MGSNLFRSAERKKAKLRLALCGAAGSGKTMSSLLIAKGLGDKIAVIDTERGSSELYSDISDFDVCVLEPPFKVEKYIEAIDAANEAKYDVIIIDSISHLWAGEGGLLDQHTAITSKTANSYTAWSKITPLHNRFIDSMLQSQSHVIATMRSKTEYVLERNEQSGKTTIRKVGLAPVQRDTVTFEFTIVFDLDSDHMAVASKDRTAMFSNTYFRPSEEIGRKIKKWLDLGVEGGAAQIKHDSIPIVEEENSVVKESVKDAGW